MKEEATRIISEQTIFALSIYTFALGAIAALLIILFGILLLRLRLFRRWSGPEPTEILFREIRDLLMHQGPGSRDFSRISAWAAAVYSDHLARRNEFWVGYGQLTVAVLLLTMLTVLLLTKTINPDAGLPILSGIAGFTIAKSTGQNRSTPAPPRGETEG